MSEVAVNFFTKFPIEFMGYFATIIGKSIPQVREGSAVVKNMPRYGNFEQAVTDSAIAESLQNLSTLLSIYDSYLLDNKTYCRKVFWKCNFDTECMFETSSVDAEITIVLARLALLNLSSAFRLLADAEFYHDTAKIIRLLKQAIVSFTWASRKADHPKFDGYNNDRCVFKKCHFLRAFSQLSEVFLYLLDIEYNCEYVSFASDAVLDNVANAVKAASRAVLSSAGSSSDCIRGDLAYLFSVVHKSCDLLYQTLRAVQSFYGDRSDSEENAIIYVSKMQAEAAKENFKNLEEEFVRVARWLLKVKQKSLGILDALKKIMDDSTTRFPIEPSSEHYKSKTSDVFAAMRTLIGCDVRKDARKSDDITFDDDLDDDNENRKCICSICHTDVLQQDGYMQISETKQSAHLLCFCIQSTAFVNGGRVRTVDNGNFSTYTKCASTVLVHFPNCSHDKMPLKTLLIAGDRRRIFFCDECTALPSSVEQIINEWASQGDLSHNDPLKIVTSKSRQANKTKYVMLSHALENNSDPAYIKQAYDDGTFGYASDTKLSPVKDLCIMQPDLDVVATLSDWGYTVSEMISMGLNSEMAVAGTSFKTLVLHRDISPAAVLASQSFQFTATKMLLAGVKLSDIADVGYMLNDLVILKLTARVFVAGGGDEATLRKLLKHTQGVSLRDFLEKEESDSTSHSSIQSWLTRAYFTVETLSLL